eukprot:g2095.t1
MAFMPEETIAEKFTRKFKADPLVPIGAGATAVVLFGGLASFMKPASREQSRRSQNFMRARVGLQGITIAILAYGTFYASVRKGWDEKDKKARSIPKYKYGDEEYDELAGTAKPS